MQLLDFDGVFISCLWIVKCVMKQNGKKGLFCAFFERRRKKIVSLFSSSFLCILQCVVCVEQSRVDAEHFGGGNFFFFFFFFGFVLFFFLFKKGCNWIFCGVFLLGFGAALWSGSVHRSVSVEKS
jgi:hypothetical protein